MGVREDRLQAEYATLKKWRSDVVSWVTVGTTNPPDKYEFTYNLRSIVGFDANREPIYHTGFKVEIVFPLDYPRSKPEVFFSNDSKPWSLHPNIWSDGRFCLEATQHWIPGIGAPIDSICQMIGEMIAFQEVYLKSPANSNEILLDWVEKNIKLETGTANRVQNPIDTSMIRLPDIEDTIAWGSKSNDTNIKDTIIWDDESDFAKKRLIRNITIVVEHTGKRIPVNQVDEEVTADQLLNALAVKINLPEGTRGVITKKRTHKQILPKQSLLSAGVQDEEILIADFERTAGGDGIAGRDIAGNNVNEKAKSEAKKNKNLKISVVYPKLLSKRFESTFLIHVYFPEDRSEVNRNINLVFRKQETNEHLLSSSIKLGQRIKIKLFSPAFDFPESVTKLIDNTINKITFLGMPKDNCEPGFHKVLISISEADTDQEFESFAISVRVVDFAFDHVSRPMLSKVSAIVLGVGSFAMFILTSLEQIDKTVGLTSGTAAGVLAIGIYASFYNLFQRVRSNTP